MAGHYVDDHRIITVYEDTLGEELGTPKDQGHDDHVELTPVVWHGLVLEGDGREGPLKPATLKVMAKLRSLASTNNW